MGESLNKRTTIVLFLAIVGFCECGFQKDLDLDVTFPPILERRHDIITGHLRPLGWQNRAEAPVKEESVTLKSEKFWDEYINKSEPIVLRGLVMSSNAVEQWTDIYLNRNYGQLEIQVTKRRQTFQSIEETTTRMTFKKFLQNYRVEDWYLRGIMPQEMFREASLPHLINCGPFVIDDSTSLTTFASGVDELLSVEEFRSRLAKEILSGHVESSGRDKKNPKLAQLIEPYLWMSAGETSSLLHSHPQHNLHCVIDGRKDFILVPTKQFFSRSTSFDPEKKYQWRKQLDLYETFKNSDEWYSKIDVDKVNAYKYRIVTEMKWLWSSLRAGDCIFIPSGWLHQIRSYGRGISTSIYFNLIQLEQNKDKLGAIKSEQFSLCDPKAPLFDSIESVASHFLWTYTHSERHLNRKSFTEPAHAKIYLLYLIRLDKQLPFERFAHFYDSITLEIKQQLDTYQPIIRDLVSLNSSQIWEDFFSAETPEIDRSFLNLSQIEELGISHVARFIKILGLAANFHEFGNEYKVGRDEL